MDELISRQDAIDAVQNRHMMLSKEKVLLINDLENLPPAQPKRGKWVKLDMHRGMADHKCSVCEQECYVPTCMGEPMYVFCPNCGAKMEVTT